MLHASLPPPVFQVALWREIFIKWFLRQHQLFKRLPAGAAGATTDEDNACKESSDQNGLNLFPNGDRATAHSSGARGVIHIGEEGKAEQFCCVQRGAFAASEKLSIQPIVCFQIHFEFLSPKLGREKVAN